MRLSERFTGMFSRMRRKGEPTVVRVQRDPIRKVVLQPAVLEAARATDPLYVNPDKKNAGTKETLARLLPYTQEQQDELARHGATETMALRERHKR